MMSLTTCANIGVGPDCPADGSPLGYAPNLAASIAFLSLFAVSLIAHVVWGIRYRTWTFMACMVLGSMTEVIGYVGRVFMYKNPYNLSTYVLIIRMICMIVDQFCRFLVQVVCLTTAPAFYSAALYLCLARM